MVCSASKRNNPPSKLVLDRRLSDIAFIRSVLGSVDLDGSATGGGGIMGDYSDAACLDVTLRVDDLRGGG